jgi:hypothetical protein
MAIPRYRVADSKGAYMALNPEPQLLALGADHNAAAVYGIRAPVYQLFPQGREVEFSGVPGPHLEPLNDAAREAMAAYWKAHPGATLDPTRTMPLGQDPLGGRSVEQLVSGLLERMDSQAPAGVAPGAEIAALLAGQKAMQDAIASLAAVLAGALAPPANPVAKGRAA